MTTTATPGSGRARDGLAAKLVSVPLVVAIVVLGVWLTGGVLTNDFKTAMALTGVFFVAFGAGLLLFTRSRRQLRLPVLGAFVVSSAIIGGYLAWTTFRDDEVNERVVVGAPPAQARGSEPPARAGNVERQSGSFAGIAHTTTGRAAVVELAGGGKRLTLTDFETDPGPDLRVYLAAGNPTDGESDDFKDLGGLKGNRGNQQYVIDGIDTSRYSTVVIWCRAFTVAFGQAPLRGS